MKASDIHNKTLEEDILKSRPHLKPNSVSTYRNALKKIYSLAKFPDGLDIKYSLLYTEPDKVVEALKDVPSNIRKTFYSALVVFVNDKSKAALKIYGKEMRDDMGKYKEDQSQNKMSEQQKANWLSWSEIMTKVEALKKKVTPLWKETSLTRQEFALLQSYVLISCYTMIPPRRATDYMNLKYKNDDELSNFYYPKKSLFCFRVYKTAKIYGIQEEEIPKALKLIINRWIAKKQSLTGDQFAKIRESDYIFNTFAGNQLSNTELTGILNSIFDKKISVSMLRHIYITDKLAPKINELKAVAGDMGHSVSQQALYVKND